MEFKLSEIELAAKKVLEAAEGSSSGHATVITFSGDLGAGKTTTIQEMGKLLGVAEGMQSPTFVIYKIYELHPSVSQSLDSSPYKGEHPANNGKRQWKRLIHGDMYRLETSDEILKLGWNELLADPSNIICIEWPEKIESVIPEYAIKVVMSHRDEETRILDIY